jgi:hypothetical protein
MTRRDKYYYQLRSLRIPGAVGATVSPFFSKRNVLYLEPVITQKVEQLCQLINKHAVEMTPINLSDILYAFCNEYGLV